MIAAKAHTINLDKFLRYYLLRETTEFLNSQDSKIMLVG